MWMSFTLCFMLNMRAGDGPGIIAEAMLSSRENAVLFTRDFVAFSRWQRYENGWFFSLRGEKTEEKGLRIFRWSDRSGLEELGFTTAREGFADAKTLAVNPSGDRVLMEGWVSSLVFRFDLETGAFERAHTLANSDFLMFWDAKRVVYGNRYPDNRLQVLDGEPLPAIAEINGRLNDDAYHPSEGRVNANRMHVAKDGSRVALGYSLYEKVFLFEGSKVRELSIRFPDLAPPPKTFVKSSEKYPRWFSGFYHLAGLRWFRGSLFALFRKGFDDSGLWVKVLPREPAYRWDNNKAPYQVIAMDGDEAVCAESTESEEEVIWRIWRRSSLP